MWSNKGHRSQEALLRLIKVNLCHQGHTVGDETGGGFILWCLRCRCSVTGAESQPLHGAPRWRPTSSARQTALSAIEKLRTATDFIRQARGDDHPSVAQFVVRARTVINQKHLAPIVCLQSEVKSLLRPAFTFLPLPGPALKVTRRPRS